MRLNFVAAILMAMSLEASAQGETTSYWFLLKEDGHTWCGYSHEDEFSSDVKQLTPTESARVTYSSNKLTEFTYQVEPISGDWVVVDKYTLSGGEVALRRANLLAQDNLQIIQETSIHGGKVEPFRLISTTTLDGKRAEPSGGIDLPPVPVNINLTALPFLLMAAEMRKGSNAMVCKVFR